MLARALPHLHLFACMCVCVCVYWCCINKSNQRTFLSNPTQNETERRTWQCYCVIIFRVYEAGKGGREWEQRLDYFRVNSVCVCVGRKEGSRVTVALLAGQVSSFSAPATACDSPKLFWVFVVYRYAQHDGAATAAVNTPWN